MAEYIERAAAAEFFEKSKQVMWHKDDVAATVSSDKIPAADVVEVVRCKDCLHYDRGQCYHPRLDEHTQSTYQAETDFCSYGEAKMDGKGEGNAAD